MQMLAKGGSAADAAVAASAVLAVTTQHMCGMGGDLWALVHDGNGAPTALNSSGRAGSGSDAGQLRSEGHSTMPFRGDMRSVPVPGCVDGWTSLHDRYGRLSLAEVLEPAAQIAETGFAPTDHLESAIPRVLDVDGAADYIRYSSEGGLLTRPGLAEALRSIGEGGRDAWYGGRFGEELTEKGAGLFSESDLAQSCADWVDPIQVDRWGHTLWTVPPNSQGYLTLLAADIGAELLADDVDPDDPRWAHLLIEASKQAAVDRSAVLHESTSVEEVFAPAEVQRRRAAIDPERASKLTAPAAGGGTIYLCAVDDNRMGVSLMQSNAAGFGSHLALPGVGVFLHNRGIGFSLEPGHPAELKPGGRPPSTLCPALITTASGQLHTVLGTMGGDGQPQVVLQLMARTLQAAQDPGTALSAPRFTLTVPDAVGFDTWAKPDKLTVALEQGSAWAKGLESRGHDVQVRPWGAGLFGHANMISVDGERLLGVAEPRPGSSAAVGL